MTSTVNGSRPTFVADEYLPPAGVTRFDLDDRPEPVDTDVVTVEDAEKPTKPRLNPFATIVADLRTSWAAVAEPPSLTDWLAGPTTSAERVPDNNGPLRWTWTVDNWITGVFFLAVSIVAFGAGAITRWLACHPARRWSALLLLAAAGTYLWLA